MCVRALSHVMRHHEQEPARFLCPWDSPGKSTGVGYHFLHQGMFLTQGLNPFLLHWQVETIILTERSQSRRITHPMVPFR